MRTYSESRIELQNLQILPKMLEKSSQFLSSEQPCEPKSFDVALKIAGLELPAYISIQIKKAGRTLCHVSGYGRREIREAVSCYTVFLWSSHRLFSASLTKENLFLTDRGRYFFLLTTLAKRQRRLREQKKIDKIKIDSNL